MTACKICNSEQKKFFLTCKDHTVSRETFTIVECEDCSFRYTENAPNQDQIGPYYKSENYVSHTSSKKGFINTVYNRVRKKTLKSKELLIRKHNQQQTGKLLDIGAGTGHFIKTCLDKNWNVTGLEPDKDARKLAKDLNKIDLKPLGAFFELSEKFNSITMWHVLEHVHQLNPYFEKIYSLLENDGHFFIAVPNCNSWDARHYKEFWAAYDVPRHLYHFREKDIKSLAEKHGFNLEKILPMKYDAYYVSLLSEQYKGGSKFKAFINGWKSNRKIGKYGASSQIYILKKQKQPLS